MKALIAAAALILSAGAAHAQQTSTVTFQFDTGSSTGTVRAVLFNSEAAYGGGAPVAQAAVAVTPGTTTVVFENLPAGDYAMRAFHDWDDDGELDFNPFGMPTEPYAFSNNARGNMGPASWERARFHVDGAVTQAIEIK